LAKRLLAWDEHWPELQKAIFRDCNIPNSWVIQPWAFIPKQHYDALKRNIASLSIGGRTEDMMPYPRITYLESVVPWAYNEIRLNDSLEDKA